MDRVARHHELLRDLVETFAAEWKPRDGTRIESVTDSRHGHYQVVRTGWVGAKFVYRCLVHFAIRGEVIHILTNETDIEWSRELIERGVAPDEIVLAFRETMRPRVVVV